MALELGADEASGDLYRPEYVTSYREPRSGLRSDGKEISNIFPPEFRPPTGPVRSP